MIRVLRIMSRFNIGGPTYNATFLTRYLSDEFETMLVGGLPEEGEADSLYILKEYGVEPVLIPELKRTPDLKSDKAAYRKIKKIIEDFKPHIVHTHAAKAGAIGRRAAKACNVPIIVHTYHGHVFHSYFSKSKTWIFKNIERYLARLSTSIIAISNEQKKELSKDFKICKPEKIKVIPLGFDLEKFHVAAQTKREITRQTYNLSEDDVAIAIVGRLAPIKNHAFFLEVVDTIFEKRGTKNLKIFIVGDGELREEIETNIHVINQKYGGEPIIMTSWIKDIPSFNAGMDIICLTSKNEGTPVSLIEAQASGVPVITTNVGGVKDIIDEEKTGFIVDDKVSFVEKMLLLIENKEIRKKMSQNGWTYVQEKFHYTRLVNDMEMYYKQLLKNKGLEC